MPLRLQESDYYDYLLACYFGRNGNELDLCLDRAYGDFKRTIHGIGEQPKADEARNRAGQFLKEKISSIQAMKAPTQSQFDNWHRSVCFGLATIYEQCDYAHFFVGQAQKWINMTFKYIFAFRERRLRGFGHLYDTCHAPLDKEFIKGLLPYGFSPLPCAWSRLNDYESYLDRQHWLRCRFELAPLDVEFRIWMGQPLASGIARSP